MSTMASEGIRSAAEARQRVARKINEFIFSREEKEYPGVFPSASWGISMLAARHALAGWPRVPHPARACHPCTVKCDTGSGRITMCVCAFKMPQQSDDAHSSACV